MNTIIEKIRAEIERLKKNEIELMENSTKEYGDYPPSSDIMLVAYQNVLSVLSDLEKEEKPKRVRTLEREFDGYNSIVITLDKHVLESIGVSRHNKVIIKIQRKED